MTWLLVRHEAIRHSLLAAVVALGMILALARMGWACSCGGSWELKDAEVIFRGEVIEVHEPLHLQITPSSRHGFAATAWWAWASASRTFDEDVRTVFRVDEVWRGEPAEYVTVNTGSGLCCDCSLGRQFKVGHEYVVYAWRWNGELHIGGCAGRAHDVSPASLAELASLGMGKGKPPASGGGYVPVFWRHLLLPLAFLGPILLTAIGWLRRAQRRQRMPSA